MRERFLYRRAASERHYRKHEVTNQWVRTRARAGTFTRPVLSAAVRFTRHRHAAQAATHGLDVQQRRRMLARRRALDSGFTRRCTRNPGGAVAVREGTDRRRRRLPGGEQERADAETLGGTNTLSFERRSVWYTSNPSGMSAAAIPVGEKTLRSGCLRRDSLTHGLGPLHILPSRFAVDAAGKQIHLKPEETR